MRVLLIIATLVEIVLVVGALAYFLSRITATLRATSALLGKVTFGVRAIETQCQVIGPSVLQVNDQLAVIAAALADLGGLATAAAGPARRR